MLGGKGGNGIRRKEDKRLGAMEMVKERGLSRLVMWTRRPRRRGGGGRPWSPIMRRTASLNS